MLQCTFATSEMHEKFAEGFAMDTFTRLLLVCPAWYSVRQEGIEAEEIFFRRWRKSAVGRDVTTVGTGRGDCWDGM